MKKVFFMICAVLLIASCKSTRNVNDGKSDLDFGSPRVRQVLVNDQMFRVTEYATDKTYGYTKENPIMVGGGSEGPRNQRRFLNALAGPNGEPVSYQRLGSCCPFHSKNGMFGNSGMLDKYEIMYEGLETPIILYINMYDSDVLKVPFGFTSKRDIFRR